MELYVQKLVGMEPGAVSTLFLDVLGSSSQDVVLDYSTHSKQYYPAAGALACGSAPPAVWQGDSAVWSVDVSCEGGGWYAFEGQNGLERTTIEVATDGRYAFETGGLRGPGAGGVARAPIVSVRRIERLAARIRGHESASGSAASPSWGVSSVHPDCRRDATGTGFATRSG